MTAKIRPPRFQATRVLAALMVREMITRYGRSWGGYFWAILEPLGVIAILTFTFSQFIKTPPLGASFALFYATGYIPFHFFSEISNAAGTAVQLNRPLLQFPMVTPIDTVLARFLLSFLTLIVVSVILFWGIFLIIDQPMQLSLPKVVVAFVGAALLGLGVGCLNAFLFAMLPVWRQIWGILTRPLFIISCVFFTFQSLPETIQALLWWNPLVHAVGGAREGFYPIYDASYVSFAYLYGCGAFCLLLGLALLARHRSDVTGSD